MTPEDVAAMAEEVHEHGSLNKVDALALCDALEEAWATVEFWKGTSVGDLRSTVKRQFEEKQRLRDALTAAEAERARMAGDLWAAKNEAIELRDRIEALRRWAINGTYDAQHAASFMRALDGGNQ